MRTDWAGLAARVLVGLVLVFSGTLKASSPAEEFAVVIESYRLVPPEAALTLAALMPWAELLVGFSMILGYLTRAAAAAAGGLLLTFIAALASTKLRGIVLPHCGCFGEGVHLSATATLLMDTALAGLAVLAYRRGESGWSLDRWAGMGR